LELAAGCWPAASSKQYYYHLFGLAIDHGHQDLFIYLFIYSTGESCSYINNTDVMA